MSGTTLATVVEILQSTGPYGIMTIVGWAFWKVNEKKDKELCAYHEKLIDMQDEQTETITRVELALTALREALKVKAD